MVARMGALLTIWRPSAFTARPLSSIASACDKTSLPCKGKDKELVRSRQSNANKWFEQRAACTVVATPQQVGNCSYTEQWHTRTVAPVAHAGSAPSHSRRSWRVCARPRAAATCRAEPPLCRRILGGGGAANPCFNFLFF